MASFLESSSIMDRLISEPGVVVFIVTKRDGACESKFTSQCRGTADRREDVEWMLKLQTSSSKDVLARYIDYLPGPEDLLTSEILASSNVPHGQVGTKRDTTSMVLQQLCENEILARAKRTLAHGKPKPSDMQDVKHSRYQYTSCIKILERANRISLAYSSRDTAPPRLQTMIGHCQNSGIRRCHH